MSHRPISSRRAFSLGKGPQGHLKLERPWGPLTIRGRFEDQLSRIKQGKPEAQDRDLSLYLNRNGLLRATGKS